MNVSHGHGRKPRSRRQHRHCPTCESLEIRRALSGFGSTDPDPPPGDFGSGDFGSGDFGGVGDFPPVGLPISVVALDPLDGGTIDGRHTRLSVVFDSPLDSLSNSWSGVLQLEHVRPNGTLVPIALGEATLDDSGMILSIEADFDLPDGEYRLSIAPGVLLLGSDGLSSFESGVGQVVATFQVESGSNFGFDQAENLGVIGSTPLAFPVGLDLATNPFDVKLYRFEVAPGHRWRLGAELQSQRLGGSLQGALTLFDSTGRVLSVATTGRSDAPLDPYFFAGLEPGVYYLGVSSQANVPTHDGGYDPSTGFTGVLAQSRESGQGLLTLVADAADAPVKVRGLKLNRGDLADPTPTGFTLRMGGIVSPGAAAGGVRVVDSRGREVPVVLVGYDEAAGTLEFVFRSRPPLGSYSVVQNTDSPLVDLTGRSVEGQTPGVLATFKLSTAKARATGDTGIIWPDAAEEGVRTSFSLNAGASVQDRWVLPVGGLYLLDFAREGAPVRLTLTNEHGSVVKLDRTSPTSGSMVLNLEAGAYYVSVESLGDGPTTLSFYFRTGDHLPDSIVPNGVGQGPALQLRIASPGAESFESTGTSESQGGWSGGASLPSVPPLDTTSTPTLANITQFNANPQTLTIVGDVVGRPSVSPLRVAAVATSSGLNALAMAGDGAVVAQAVQSPRSDTGLPGSEATPTAWDDPDLAEPETPPAAPPAPPIDAEASLDPAAADAAIGLGQGLWEGLRAFLGQFGGDPTTLAASDGPGFAGHVSTGPLPLEPGEREPVRRLDEAGTNQSDFTPTLLIGLTGLWVLQREERNKRRGRLAASSSRLTRWFSRFLGSRHKSSAGAASIEPVVPSVEKTIRAVSSRPPQWCRNRHQTRPHAGSAVAGSRRAS